VSISWRSGSVRGTNVSSRLFLLLLLLLMLLSSWWGCVLVWITSVWSMVVLPSGSGWSETLSWGRLSSSSIASTIVCLLDLDSNVDLVWWWGGNEEED